MEKIFVKQVTLLLHVDLTHCGRVTPYGGIDLGQQWLR